MVVLVLFCSLMTIVFFTILKNTIGMRTTEEEEIAGLDLPLMGALAYPDFLEAQGSVFYPVETGAAGAVGPATAASLREEVSAQ
jgi:Amt family ammonium transporter